ncbi:MAG: four helix bundle protein [Candidatus Peregrinibacteria bacterium]
MERKFKGGFRNLIAWKEAKSLALEIYGITKKFPKEEQFGLVSQLRRAAASIMANLAEGSAMGTKVHRDTYYMRARGSAVEVDSFLELSFDLTYLTREAFEDCSGHVARAIYLITHLMRS